MRKEKYLKSIEAFLSAQYLSSDHSEKLYEAIRYSLLAGGKRLRPMLTLASAELCGGDAEKALPFACAVEMLHTYSLIHDDLPCMDNDTMRRGKPTNHVAFDEATAVLAGDALLTDAFTMLSSAPLNSKQIAQGVQVLARAAGGGGMVMGQALDIAKEGQNLTLRELSELQSLKTGALFTASVELGAIAAGAGEKARGALVTYAMRLGRAFQMRDDILDETGKQEVVGKTLGTDRRKNKYTFVTALGLKECQKQLSKLTEEAIVALSVFPYDETEFLRKLAASLTTRNV